MWKLKPHLVLNCNNQIPFLFLCMVVYVFLIYLPLSNWTLINYFKTFKNKCGRYDQWINNIKPINNQNTVFAKKKIASEGNEQILLKLDSESSAFDYSKTKLLHVQGCDVKDQQVTSKITGWQTYI